MHGAQNRFSFAEIAIVAYSVNIVNLIILHVRHS